MGEATKTFLAVYLGSPGAMEAWRNKSESERKACRPRAWRHGTLGREAQGSDRQSGARSQDEARQRRRRRRRPQRDGVYMVVRAESHEAAAQMFADHPTSRCFPARRSRSWSAAIPGR